MNINKKENSEMFTVKKEEEVETVDWKKVLIYKDLWEFSEEDLNMRKMSIESQIESLQKDLNEVNEIISNIKKLWAK